MPHEVRIFKGHPDQGGTLKKIIRGEDLSYIDDPIPGKSSNPNRYKGSGKHRPETIICEVCKRTVSFEHHKQKTCRRVLCIAGWKKIRAARNELLKKA